MHRGNTSKAFEYQCRVTLLSIEIHIHLLGDLSPYFSKKKALADLTLQKLQNVYQIFRKYHTQNLLCSYDTSPTLSRQAIMSRCKLFVLLAFLAITTAKKACSLGNNGMLPLCGDSFILACGAIMQFYLHNC